MMKKYFDLEHKIYERQLKFMDSRVLLKHKKKSAKETNFILLIFGVSLLAFPDFLLMLGFVVFAVVAVRYSIACYKYEVSCHREAALLEKLVAERDSILTRIK